jgi:dTMP kinase
MRPAPPSESRPSFARPFLSLDGLDGTGKSSQCRLLARWLRDRGYAVTECIDPGGTPLGAVIRQLLLDQRQVITVPCEALLFMASRAQLAAEVIRPALEAGQVVISDRFTLANVVYQGHAGGLDSELLWKVGHMATGGLEPDLTLVLDMPVEEALERRKGAPADRVESRELQFHLRVREGFRLEAERHPERIRLVDARPAVGVVHRHIIEEVSRVLEAGPRA